MDLAHTRVLGAARALVLGVVVMDARGVVKVVVVDVRLFVPVHVLGVLVGRLCLGK